jgi:prepilin-type N-terminal cleavage/methylation domain-containing protein
MPNTSVSRRAFQAGRTLIELLIAMAIGLVIVIGVSALYLSSSGISRTANQISTAEQAGQLALLLIGDSMKRAAYGEIIGSDYAAQGQTLMDGVHLAGCTGTTFTDPFPAYVLPPAAQTPPDLSCTVASGGDSIYVRYQAAPVIAQMLPADAAGISMRDCGASLLNQNQVLSSQQLRAGAGLERPMVTNVFRRDPANNTLDCAGYGNTGTFLTLLQNVVEFRVFYRFDDAAYAAGSSGVTNAVPFGGSIRDAAAINALAGAIDPWNYVVAAMVCLTIQTDEVGSGTSATNFTAPRCPASALEAGTGLGLVTTTTDGRIRRTFSQVFTLRNRATPSPSIL